jgi:hypothetical protein
MYWYPLDISILNYQAKSMEIFKSTVKINKQIHPQVIYTVPVWGINCQWYGRAHVLLFDNTQDVQYWASRGTLHWSLLLQCNCLQEQEISHKPCIYAHNPQGNWRTCPSNTSPRFPTNPSQLSPWNQFKTTSLLKCSIHGPMMWMLQGARSSSMVDGHHISYVVSLWHGSYGEGTSIVKAHFFCEFLLWMGYQISPEWLPSGVTVLCNTSMHCCTMVQELQHENALCLPICYQPHHPQKLQDIE